MNFTFWHSQKTHTNSGLDPRDAHPKHGYQGYGRPPNELICQSLNTTHTQTHPLSRRVTHTHTRHKTSRRWQVGGGVCSKWIQLHQLCPTETQTQAFPINDSLTQPTLLPFLVAKLVGQSTKHREGWGFDSLCGSFLKLGADSAEFWRFWIMCDLPVTSDRSDSPSQRTDLHDRHRCRFTPNTESGRDAISCFYLHAQKKEAMLHPVSLKDTNKQQCRFLKWEVVGVIPHWPGSSQRNLTLVITDGLSVSQ